MGTVAAVPAAAVWSRRTERRVRRLEERARAAERLAELGTLTGGLAHEIKNPLSTLGLNVQLVQEDLSDLERGGAGGPERPTSPSAWAAPDAGSTVCCVKATGCATSSKTFCVTQAGSNLTANRPTSTRSASSCRISSSRRPIRPGSACVWTCARIPPGVGRRTAAETGPAELDDQRLPGHGRGPRTGGAPRRLLRVDPADREPHRARGQGRERRPSICTSSTPAPGMDEKTAASIFRPYVSNKRGGTGLGLPTARRIAEEHGGSLTVHTAPGQGTDFTLALPGG